MSVGIEEGLVEHIGRNLRDVRNRTLVTVEKEVTL